MDHSIFCHHVPNWIKVSFHWTAIFNWHVPSRWIMMPKEGALYFLMLDKSMNQPGHRIFAHTCRIQPSKSCIFFFFFHSGILSNSNSFCTSLLDEEDIIFTIDWVLDVYSTNQSNVEASKHVVMEMVSFLHRCTSNTFLLLLCSIMLDIVYLLSCALG